MPTATQPLNLVVDVSVTIGAVAAAAPAFNRALIVGPSTIIPSFGANSRTRDYTSLAAMQGDGWSVANPEYLAAQLYFSPSPPPQYLTVGRQDLTAIQTLIPHSGNAGTGFAVGDIVSVTQGGASFGEAIVLTETAGAVTALGLVPQNQGTGYSTAVGLATSAITGSGTGLQVDITSVGETAVQALTACRIQNTSWYLCMVTDAVDSDHLACAAFVEAATPVSSYFYATADAAVFAGATGNVMLQLEALKYKRTLGIASTTQSGLFPNNAYAAASAMGIAMGLNTGLANSSFNMKFKSMVGVAPEPVTFSQLEAVENANGNLNVSYNNVYSWLEQGTMADGSFFDELIGIDQLVADYQVSCVNLLVSQVSIPQTNPGEALIINAVNAANERARVRGFIAPGTWNGATILALESGTALPNGYYTQAQSYTLQSEADRQARKSMPVYVAIIEAGSTNSISISLNVQR